MVRSLYNLVILQYVMNLTTIRTTNNWNPLDRPTKIDREIRLITNFFTVNNWQIKKLNSRELWQIGKGDYVHFLSYTDSGCWVLFPHNDQLASMLIEALTTTDISRKTA